MLGEKFFSQLSRPSRVVLINKLNGAFTNCTRWQGWFQLELRQSQLLYIVGSLVQGLPISPLNLVNRKATDWKSQFQFLGCGSIGTRRSGHVTGKLTHDSLITITLCGGVLIYGRISLLPHVLIFAIFYLYCRIMSTNWLIVYFLFSILNTYVFIISIKRLAYFCFPFPVIGGSSIVGLDNK